MGAVNPDLMHTAASSHIDVRCGRRRQDGSTCTKSWFNAFGTTGEITLIPKDFGWTGDRWHGARQAAEDPFNDEPRWEIVCTKRCGAHPTVKKATLEHAVRGARRNGEPVVWLTDVAS